MSSRKRRIKRKIKILRKMDDTHVRRYLMGMPRRDPHIAMIIWYCNIVPLGDYLQRKGHQGWEMLDRWPSGTACLLQNYQRRMGQV